MVWSREVDQQVLRLLLISVIDKVCKSKGKSSLSHQVGSLKPSLKNRDNIMYKTMGIPPQKTLWRAQAKESFLVNGENHILLSLIPFMSTSLWWKFGSCLEDRSPRIYQRKETKQRKIFLGNISIKKSERSYSFNTEVIMKGLSWFMMYGKNHHNIVIILQLK